MHQPDRAHGHGRYHRHCNECVRDPAMMLQLLHRSCESPQHIEIGGLGSEHGGQSCVSSFAIQPGAANACAGEKVGDGLHSALKSILDDAARPRSWTALRVNLLIDRP